MFRSVNKILISGLFCFLFVALSSPSFAATYYVDAVNGNNDNAGTAPPLAWKTLTYASTMSASGDTVNVAAGTYDAALGEVFPITITGQTVTGTTPYAATIEAGASSAISVTNATVSGLTINSTSLGVNILNSNGSVVITNNKINGGVGRGVRFDGDGWTWNNVSLVGNEIVADLGIFMNGGTVDTLLVDSNKIISATGSDPGYGINLFNMPATSVTISSNEVRGYRDGFNGALTLFLQTTTNVVNRNTVVNNKIGLKISGGSITTLRNNIFDGRSVDASKGIWLADGTATSTYNDVVNNTDNYSGLSAGTGDISSDPQYVNSDSNNYYLNGSSPCVAAGLSGVDMGAYNYNGPTTPALTSPPDEYTTNNNKPTFHWGAVAGGVSYEITVGAAVLATLENVSLYTLPDSLVNGTYNWKVRVKNSGGTWSNYSTSRAITINTSVATTYFIDATTGSNTYDGTTTEVSGLSGPWQTLTYAATQGASGDTYRVASGIYDTATNGEIFPLSVSGKYFLSTSTNLATIDAGAAFTENIIVLGANTTLEGFSVVGSTATEGLYGVHVNGANCNVINNIINVNATSPVANNFSLYIQETSTATRISNNTIIARGEAGGLAIGLRAAADVNISNNTITNSVSGGTAIRGERSSDPIVNTTFDGNVITADIAINLKIPPSVTNFSLTSNTIEALSAVGTGIEIVAGTLTATSNEVRGYDTAFRASGGTLTANKNTIVKNTQGVVFADTATGTLTDNIISSSPSFRGATVPGSVGIGNSGSGTITATYNNVYNNVTNFDGTITSSNNVTTCPRFTDVAGNVYTIHTDSPSYQTASDGGNRGRYSDDGTISPIRTTSYVDANIGVDDPARGAAADNAYKTITYALGSTEGIVNVLGGTYDVSTNGETFPLTIGAGQGLSKYDSDPVIIDSETTDSDTIDISSSEAVFSGFTVSNQAPSQMNCLHITVANVNINNNLVTSNGLSSGVLVEGAGCTIDDNTVTVEVGGAQNYGIDVEADNSIITNNRVVNKVTDGVGILTSFPISLIQSNEVQAGQIGIQCNGATDALVNRNTVSAYVPASGIVGIFLQDSIGTISNNEVKDFRGSVDPLIGGGIWVGGAGMTVLVNKNTLVKNLEGIESVDTGSGGGTINATNNIIAAEVGGVTITGSIGFDQQAGTINASYNDVYVCDTSYVNCVSGEGSLGLDPLFVNATIDNYQLLAESPCIGAGVGGVDMGAHDFTGPGAPTLIVPANGSSTEETRPRFEWQAVSGAVSYEVRVDTTTVTTLGAVTSLETVTSFEVGVHSWEVRAKNNAETWGTYSSTWQFTVVTTTTTTTTTTGTSTTTTSTTTTSDTSSTTTSSTTTTTIDTNPPEVTIYSIGTDSSATLLRNTDAINARQHIRGRLTDDKGIIGDWVRVYVDGSTVSGTTITIISPVTVEVDYTPPTDLSVGSHVIKIEARDTVGNLGTGEVTGLRVSGGAVSGSTALAYPTRVTPDNVETLRFSYELTTDADIMISVYNESKQLVWSQRYTSGTAGGRSGYNEIPFNNLPAATRASLARGPYRYIITSGGNLLTSGYFFID